MNGINKLPQEEKLKQLKQILPEAFSEGKVDWEKLKATLGEDINFSNERYVLNWAGKSDAFRVLQAPSTRTLVPVKKESVNFDETENIFIEGENLEVLKVLQKSYFGKVKLIYIDPPYNTGNDSFIYPDKFSETKDEYHKRVGDKDEEGYMTKEGLFRKNSKENGQYHSNWLNMMYPRLYLAKNLLKQDGVIFVSIDDNEVYNLRLMMNEIFGEENFVENFIWRSRLGKGSTSKQTATLHEYILCYSKSIKFTKIASDIRIKLKQEKERLRQWGQGDSKKDRPTMYYAVYSEDFGEVYPIKPDGTKGRWRLGKDKFKELQSQHLVVFEKQTDGRVEAYKIIPKGSKTETAQDSILNADTVKTTAHGSREIKKLFNFNIFDYPKPTTLLSYLISISCQDGFILDFFSGSGTTAHAVMDLNREDGGKRKYICVQLSEQCDKKSEAYKEGYKTIADISRERIRRASNKIKEGIASAKEKEKEQIVFEPKKEEAEIDLGFKVLKLSESNFKQWKQIKGKDAKALAEQMKLFVDPVSDKATIENMVYELLLKSGKDLNSKIEHKENYYCINNNELVFMLEKATQEIVDAVLKEHPQKVVALDRLFKGNDQLKTNTALQMKDAEIEFKTI